MKHIIYKLPKTFQCSRKFDDSFALMHYSSYFDQETSKHSKQIGRIMVQDSLVTVNENLIKLLEISF